MVDAELSPVIESPPEVAAPVVPETKVTEPVVAEAPPPEPPPPYWANRKYVRRAFCFPFAGVEIQGNFFDVGGGRLDADGLYGKVEFESIDHLIRLSGASGKDADALIARIQKVLT